MAINICSERFCDFSKFVRSSSIRNLNPMYIMISSKYSNYLEVYSSGIEKRFQSRSLSLRDGCRRKKNLSENNTTPWPHLAIRELLDSQLS